jgi:hypothetical protein
MASRKTSVGAYAERERVIYTGTVYPVLNVGSLRSMPGPHQPPNTSWNIPMGRNPNL